VIGRREKLRFKVGFKSSKTVRRGICRGREFQLLGEESQKDQEAKEDSAQEETARR